MIVKKMILALAVLLTFELSSQCTVPVSQNVTEFFHWDDNTLPHRSGNYFNDVWGYADSLGNEYAILGGADEIYVFDVTDPGNTVLIDSDDPSDNGNGVTIWRDFKTFDHYLYAVSDEGGDGLRVYDLDSLESGKLHLVGSYNNLFGRAHNIFIEEQYSKLYVAGSNTVGQGLIVYDLSSDSLARNPGLLKSVRLDVVAGNLSLNTYIHDVFVEDNIAYCSHGWLGYGIWDLSDLDSLNVNDFLSLMDNSTTTGNSYVHNSWNTSDNQYAYMSTEVNNSNPSKRQIYIIDQSDKTDPLLVGTWKKPLLECTGITNNLPHNTFVVGDKLFFSSYEDGVQILDISDPINPIRIGYYDTYANNSYNSYEGCWGVHPFLPSGLILASDISNGLFVLKLDDCASTQSLDSQMLDEMSIVIASDSIIMSDVMVTSGNPVTLIAPMVQLDNDLIIETGADVRIINMDLCD